MIFSLVSCGNKNSDSTINNNAIYDIYKLYVNNGGTLTYDQWLESIKGEKGETGPQGEKGETGPQGEKGETGENGVGISSTLIDSNGDLIITFTDGSTLNAGHVVGKDGENYYSNNESGLAFYLLNDDTYGVAQGTSTYLSEVTIPATFNGKKVTRILKNGFKKAKIRRLNISKNITTIEDEAFFECENLNSLYIDSKKINVVAINEYCSNIDGIEVGLDVFTHTDFPYVSILDGEKDAYADVKINNFSNEFDSVEYDISLNSLTDINSNGTIELMGNQSNYAIDMKTYGNFKDMEFTFYKNNEEYAKVYPENIGITNTEYNFAELNATYPVLVFSLKLKEITKNGEIPTFVNLERYNSYNWDSLPYNLSYLPNVDRNTAISGGFHTVKYLMADYIKELYELNPESHFNFYAVDNYVELIFQMLVSNGIPSSNWNAVLLSDGSGTAAKLVEAFAVENPKQKLSDMTVCWNNAMNYYSNHEWDDGKYLEENAICPQEYYSILYQYPYVATKAAANVDWWVNRLRVGENLSAINAIDPELASDIVSTPKSFYTNNLLASLSDDDQAKFKNLYHFSDEMFAEATNSNKKIMIILGTSWTGEESSFYDYIKMTMAYYGDEYAYFYKGHPGYATSNFPGRQLLLDKINSETNNDIKELDCSIAAEVILFYNPDVYICGWSSSTFDSVESQSMACALYGISYSSKSNYTYGELIDSFFTKINSNSNLYSNPSLGLDSNKNYYLIEFNNSENYPDQISTFEKHEIAIYDTTTKTIKYYKLVDASTETYKEVTIDGTDVL